MKKISILLVLLTVMTSCISQNKTDIQSVDLETMKTEVVGKDAQLIDVRTPEEFSAGHIDGAVNINFLNGESFAENSKKLDKSKPVYVYCQMGGRSKKASQKLREMGFTTIFDYSGGYGEWSKSNK